MAKLKFSLPTDTPTKKSTLNRDRQSLYLKLSVACNIMQVLAISYLIYTIYF